jgi:hypothetical protein
MIVMLSHDTLYTWVKCGAAGREGQCHAAMLGKLRLKLGQLAAAQDARAKHMARARSLLRDLQKASPPGSRGQLLSLYELGFAVNPPKALAHQVASPHTLQPLPFVC